MTSGRRPIRRFTVRSREDDPRAAAITTGAAALGLAVHGDVRVADLVFVEGDLDPSDLDRLGDFLADPLLQTGSWEAPQPGDGPHAEITLHPGVTDGAADAVIRAARQLGLDVDAAATGRRIELPAATPEDDADVLLRRLVANPIIERWTDGLAQPDLHPGGDADALVRVGRRPRPRRRRPRQGGRRARPRPRPGRAGRRSATTSRRSAATRPTSSWRRSPRPGASTARTRRSAPP